MSTQKERGLEDSSPEPAWHSSQPLLWLTTLKTPLRHRHFTQKHAWTCRHTRARFDRPCSHSLSSELCEATFHLCVSVCQTHISSEVWKPEDVLFTGTETLWKVLVVRNGFITPLMCCIWSTKCKIQQCIPQGFAPLRGCNATYKQWNTNWHTWSTWTQRSCLYYERLSDPSNCQIVYHAQNFLFDSGLQGTVNTQY